MNEVRIDQMIFLGFGGSWLIGSMLLLAWCIYKGRQKKTSVKRTALYALGISNLLSPTVFGVYCYPVVMPATLGITGFVLSMAFGDLSVFEARNAHLQTLICLACWLIGYVLIFLICIPFTKNRNTRSNTSLNQTLSR